MADDSLSHVANVSSDIHMKASCQLRHTLKMLWDLPEQGQNIPKHGNSDRELPIKTQQSVNTLKNAFLFEKSRILQNKARTKVQDLRNYTPHCCHTVVTLLSHCCHTVVSHCCVTLLQDIHATIYLNFLASGICLP